MKKGKRRHSARVSTHKAKAHYCLICERFDCREDGPGHQLTPRELSVLALLGRGMTNKAIAWRLKLTVGTVDVYLSRVYQKLPPPSNDTGIRSAALLWWVSHPELHGLPDANIDKLKG